MPVHRKIEKVCVIGAGTMGSGIAAQAANAGLDVLLLDVSAEATERALRRLKKSNPPALFHEGVLGRI